MIIIADMEVNMAIPATPKAKELSSDEEVLVVLPVAMGTMAQLEERWERREEENSDEKGNRRV